MYALIILPAAEEFLRKLDSKDSATILKKLNSIRDNPFPFLSRLAGSRLWRLRISGYRAIVDVIISARKIFVVRIGKRENVYER